MVESYINELHFILLIKFSVKYKQTHIWEDHSLQRILWGLVMPGVVLKFMSLYLDVIPQRSSSRYNEMDGSFKLQTKNVPTKLLHNNNINKLHDHI